MNSEIEWINKNNELGDNEIKYVEDIFSIEFPEDYINCIKNNDGAYPVPDTFYIENNEETLNNLLSLHKDNESYLLRVYQNVIDRILEKIIPFARDPFGNLLCFDYRNNGQPIIVFWDHEKAFNDKEKAITFICNTFAELLNMLHESQE
ncbi:MAG TPA: SMI1/KNR4 family protein [Lachnospiraceae bacterium]|nr:SMI1/KNR4 family protein [Lachnospiraceae bacterium]